MVFGEPIRTKPFFGVIKSTLKINIQIKEKMKYFVLLKSFNQIFGLQNDNIDGIIEKKQLKDMQNDEAKEFMTKLFHRIDNDKSGIELFIKLNAPIFY